MRGAGATGAVSPRYTGGAGAGMARVEAGPETAGWVGLGALVGLGAALERTWPVALAGVALAVAVGLRAPVAAALLAVGASFLDGPAALALPVGGVPMTPAKALVVAAALGHVVHRVATGRPVLVLSPLTAPWLAVLLSMAVSLGASNVPVAGLPAVVGVVSLGVFVHVLYATVQPGRVDGALRGLAGLVGVVVAATLIAQRPWGDSADLAWEARATGFFGDPNAWATAQLALAPLLLAALATDPSPRVRAAWGPLAALVAVGVLQTMSRAGLVTLVVVTPAVLWAARDVRRQWPWVAVGVVVLALLALPVEAAATRYVSLVVPEVETRLGHGSLTDRRALLFEALRQFGAHPAVGVGVGQFAMNAAARFPGDLWRVAHNSYATVAAEQGALGLAAHGAFAAAWAADAWRAVQARSARAAALGAGYATSLLAVALMAATLELATFAPAWAALGLGHAVARAGAAERG